MTERRVLRAFIKNETKVINLTKIQLFICKLFKINPETKYLYTVDLKLDPMKGLHFSDILLSQSGNQWIVTNINEDTIEVRSMHPSVSPDVYGSIVVVSSSYPHGTGWPR